MLGPEALKFLLQLSLLGAHPCAESTKALDDTCSTKTPTYHEQTLLKKEDEEDLHTATAPQQTW